MLAVSGNESIICLVKKVQQSLVKRQTRPENHGKNGLFPKYVADSTAQRSLDFPFFMGQMFADFIGSHFPDAFQVAAKTHPVLLNRFVTQLANPVTEQGILFA